MSMVGASVLSVLFFVVLAAVSGGFTLLGGHFLRRWLEAPRLRTLWTLLISAASLGVVCLLMYAFGEPYFYALFLMIIWGTATVTALVFLWRARRMGRARMVVASAVLAFGYPLLLLQMPELYQSARRDDWDTCAAPLVVDALDRYRAVAGRYPARFNDLYAAYPPPSFVAPPRPTYVPLDTLRQRGDEKCLATPWSTKWLYATTGKDYVLGYWRRYPVIEPLGARVCLHQSDDPVWRCGWDRWGPFEPTH